MKILILGSEGFVGTNLVLGLKKSYDLFTADQITKGTHKNYTQFNVTNYSDVEKIVHDVDVVINLIAHTLVASLDEVIKNAQVNIIGLLNVLEACRKNNIKKIIFTSASSIIGTPSKLQVSENHTVNPKTAYGITKMTSEHYLRLYNEMFGINYTIFRFFNIYGPHQKNGLIPTLYDRLVSEKPLTIYGKGDQIRDYVFVKDIIPFFDTAISSSVADNSIFNLGTGKGTTILQIIEYISKILSIKPKIEKKPERAGEIGNFVADTKLLHSKFGDIQMTTVQDGLRATISWLNSNYK